MNTAPFSTFPGFLERRELDSDGPLGPTLMTSYTRGQTLGRRRSERLLLRG